MNSFLQHLDYADDICLLSHKMSDLQDMIESIKSEKLAMYESVCVERVHYNLFLWDLGDPIWANRKISIMSV